MTSARRGCSGLFPKLNHRPRPPGSQRGSELKLFSFIDTSGLKLLRFMDMPEQKMLSFLDMSEHPRDSELTSLVRSAIAGQGHLGTRDPCRLHATVTWVCLLRSSIELLSSSSSS